jgi:hypothetical protein
MPIWGKSASGYSEQPTSEIKSLIDPGQRERGKQ